MDNYKTLNKELIGQVQEMRVHIAMLQKEILQLRGELVDERQFRVEQQRGVISAFVRNFQHTLNDISPEINILEFLNEGTSREESTLRSSQDKREHRSSILENFRHSNEVQLRRSSLPISPTPRRSSLPRRNSNERSSSDATIIESPPLLENTPEANSEEDSAEEVHEVAEIQEDSMIIDSQLHCIKEADEEVEEESSCDDVELTQTQILRDITNRHIPGEVDMRSSKESPKISHIQMRRGKRGVVSRNDTIQVARLIVDHNVEEKENTIPGQLNFQDGIDKENTSSLSLAMSELTMGHFIDAPSSTPRTSRIVAESNDGSCTIKAYSQTVTNASLTRTSSINSSRPSRKCKPGNMTEPRINAKMRNNNAQKKKRSKSKQ